MSFYSNVAYQIYMHNQHIVKHIYIYVCVCVCPCIGLSLAQVMLYRLLGAKPLPEPVLTYCKLNP